MFKVLLTPSISPIYAHLCIYCFYLKQAFPLYHPFQCVIFISLSFLLEFRSHSLNPNDFQRKNNCLFKDTDSNFGSDVFNEVLVTFFFSFLVTGSLSFLKLILWLVLAVMNNPLRCGNTWPIFYFSHFIKSPKGKISFRRLDLERLSQWNSLNSSSCY